MPARPAARQRLADLMERRRLDLGLTWREVAEAGNISYEVIRAIRNGNGQIRPLSKRGIEVGLHWESGSVQRIEDGGDPVTLADAPAVSPAAPEQAPVAAPDPGDDVTGAVVAALFGQKERRIWAELRRSLTATPAGAALFADPAQARAWPAGSAPLQLTPEAIAVLDATPAGALLTDPADNAAIRLVMYAWPDRVAMAATWRARLGRPTVAVRRAG